MGSIRALVVDDSQAMRRNIMGALQRMGGFVFDEAVDGVDALKKFSEGSFDIVLTDINMPQMDGLKLVRHIRTALGKTDIPIVVITTESAEEDRNRAMKLGANAYLVKPVQAREVQDAVRSLLHLES
ncbi:MAG: response regulator [Myxococcaceae bacterium]|nr:response regulator [Myxococcaceae bacterium]